MREMTVQITPIILEPAQDLRAGLDQAALGLQVIRALILAPGQVDQVVSAVVFTQHQQYHQVSFRLFLRAKAFVVIPKLKMTKSVMTATKLMEMDAHQRAKKKAIAIQQIKAITPKQNAQAVFKMLIIMSYSNRLPASAHVGF
jgi:hypothetical protein